MKLMYQMEQRRLLLSGPVAAASRKAWWPRETCASAGSSGVKVGVAMKLVAVGFRRLGWHKAESCCRGAKVF